MEFKSYFNKGILRNSLDETKPRINFQSINFPSNIKDKKSNLSDLKGDLEERFKKLEHVNKKDNDFLQEKRKRAYIKSYRSGKSVLCENFERKDVKISQSSRDKFVGNSQNKSVTGFDQRTTF